MANLNKVMLIGRLTRDPESRTTTSGAKLVAFGFAVNNRRKNQQSGQWEEEPVFIDCEAWNAREGGRQLADLIEQYLKKGHQAYIEGRLRLDQWQDKNDGSKRSKLKLVVDNVQFLEPRQDGANGEGGGARPARTSAPPSAARRPAPSSPAPGGNFDEPAPDVVDEPPSGGGEDIPF